MFIYFVKRLTRKIYNISIRSINVVKLALQIKSYRITHVSTKEGKSVFKDDTHYFVVYSNCKGKDVLLLNKAVLAYLWKKGCVYAYSILNHPVKVDIISVFDLIEVFHRDQDIVRKPLSDLVKSKYRDRNIQFLRNVLFSDYDNDSYLNVCLCHGDVTNQNILKVSERLVLIDADDCFEYVESYDYIYYQVIISVGKKKVSYRDVFECLGFKENNNVCVDKVLSNISKACTNKAFNRMENILFLLKFLDNATRIDLGAELFMSKVKLL